MPKLEPGPRLENRFRIRRQNHGMSHGSNVWEFHMTTIFIQHVLLVSLRTLE